MLASRFFKSHIFLLIAFLATAMISSNANGDISADDRHFYIGAEYGVSEPVIRSFRHVDSGTSTLITLKKSQMIGGKIGYSFYPGMALEISGTYQPKFQLGYRLPEINLGGGIVIPKTNGKTDVDAIVVTANLIYSLQKTVYDVRPYLIFGAGYSRINIKPSTVKIPSFMPEKDFFRINKSTSFCFTQQAGLGFASNLTDNIELDISAKLQLANNVQIKYDSLNSSFQFEKRPRIKKTIAVGEFGIGLTYKIPV